MILQPSYAISSATTQDRIQTIMGCTGTHPPPPHVYVEAQSVALKGTVFGNKPLKEIIKLQ